MYLSQGKKPRAQCVAGLSSGVDNISDAESKRSSNLPLPSPPRCSSRTPQPERFRITWRALPGKRRRLYRCSTTSQALRPKRADRQRPCSTHPKPSKPPQPICTPRSKVSWKRWPSEVFHSCGRNTAFTVSEVAKSHTGPTPRLWSYAD
jgi:hypothetical protein